MIRKFLFVTVLAAGCAAGSGPAGEERAVRQLLERWDAAYRALDAQALAALETPDFELVNRVGWWTPFSSREEIARMWAWGFAVIYQDRPGPRHSVERVRFLLPNVAVVQARASWGKLILPTGLEIPPHGEIDTFVLVKGSEGWQIASQNIHNQMPGEELPSPAPWDRQ